MKVEHYCHLCSHHHYFQWSWACQHLCYSFHPTLRSPKFFLSFTYSAFYTKESTSIFTLLYAFKNENTERRYDPFCLVLVHSYWHRRMHRNQCRLIAHPLCYDNYDDSNSTKIVKIKQYIAQLLQVKVLRNMSLLPQTIKFIIFKIIYNARFDG